MARQGWPRVISTMFSLSYGTVGNTSINPYQTLGNLTAIPYNYGGTNTTGTYPTAVPNPNLTWEYTSTINAGIDFGIFNDRITGSLELYHSYTKSLLLPQVLPATSGIPGNFLTNVGKTENKGMEFTVTTVNIKADKKNGFNWTTNFNLSLNRGKITALSNGATRDIANNWFVGYPIGSIFDYKKIGIWQNTPADIALATKYGLTLTGNSSVIGTIKIADINGDGKLDANDRTILGSNQPTVQGGITNHISYKGFDFSFVAFIRLGNKIISQLYDGNTYVSTLQGRYNSINVNYWTPTNPTNDFPKVNYAQSTAAYGTTMSYFDGSFVKIRSMNLGYTFPSSIFRKIGAQSLRIYTAAENPFIFSKFSHKYHGIDPETDGQVLLNTPTTYSITFGVNASF